MKVSLPACLWLLTCLSVLAQAEDQLPLPDIPRIAVCFWGLTRSLWATRDSLRLNILDPLFKEGYRVQKFLHTYRVKEEKGFNVSWDDFKWLDIPDKHVVVQDIKEADLAPDTPTLETFSKSGDAWHDGGHSLKNLRLALHSLKGVTELWAGHPEDFDIVLYTRTDVWYLRQLNMSEVQLTLTSTPTIFVPVFDTWGGYNDRFAFGHPEVMVHYGMRVRSAEAFVENNMMQSEKLLLWTLQKEGVEVKASTIRFVRVRASGELYSFPDDPEMEDFTDDFGHAAQQQRTRLRRTDHGFLETVPCGESCRRKLQVVLQS